MSQIPPSREDLIGFLMGALPESEMRRIQQRLLVDPALQAMLDQVQRTMRPLDETTRPTPPAPDDLLEKTMLAVEGQQDGFADSDEEFADPTHLGGDAFDDSPNPLESCDKLTGVHESVQQVDLTDSVGSGEIRMSPVQPHSGQRHFGWAEVVAGVAAVVVVAGLLLPGVLRGRFAARKAACQENLRTLGIAMTQYAMADSSGQLPQLSGSGPQSFAGNYALRLFDSGRLTDSTNMLLCSSLQRPTGFPDKPFTSDDLQTDDVNQLAFVQRNAGGQYAYTLGVMEDGKYRSPHYEGRTQFAVLGDAPVEVLQMDYDSPDRLVLRQVAHGGQGAN
ncbi:MAG: DUF1559 domain-containing protein, partial [Planctomycetota bacterium]